jgi:PAS domain S-box-containing protein
MTTIASDLCVALVAALTDGVVIADRNLVITHATRAVHALVGWDPAALLGQPLSSLYWDPEDGERLALSDRANPSSAAPTPRALRTGSGTRKVCLVLNMELDHSVGLVLRDAGDLSEALDRVARSEASLRAVIESLPDGIVIHHGGRIVYANRALRDLWGGPLEKLMGLYAIDLVHPDDKAMVLERQRALAEQAEVAPYIYERLLRADGSVWLAQVGAVNLVYEGKPSVLAVARDVTEQRSLEARLGQADRMVALGTLAAGVAHEIGNPLTYMLLRLDAAAVRTSELRRAAAATDVTLSPTVDELAGHLAAVIDGARRVRNIVAELKVFARGDGDPPDRLDVTIPLERAMTMAAHELKNVQLVRDVSPAPPVMASDGKLTQVFLNLLLNAVHAVRAAAGAEHRITVRVWAEGGETRVAVSDTGVGITAEDLPRIFDPFYSTKPAGDGLGLGLAITESIIASLGGAIHVDSRPGAGTTFTVTLPSLRA